MHKHHRAADLLQALDLGSSIAEQDTLLETARVETSAFTDLLADKVDLIPGTKGSGKTALFRIFVDFLPQHLLRTRKVVIAHGVQKHGDNVFHIFKNQFEALTEDDFVSFWCIYLTSLAHEQFIKGEIYQPYLQSAGAEIERFRQACAHARIPEIRARKSLQEIIGWTLQVLRKWAPRLHYKLPQDAGEIDLDLFGRPNNPKSLTQDEQPDVPHFVAGIKDTLEAVLHKSDLAIWLMVDRLDEVFPRRSDLETRALRGLLRVTRLFTSQAIRIKIFLRDDMLEYVVTTEDGFTGLTHLTARQADTLQWSQDQILTMLVKRLFADGNLRTYLGIDNARLEASQEYRVECFYKVFSPAVHGGPNQSPTIRWMYNHTMDGKGVVTPRDIIDLVTRAKQVQQDTFNATPESESPWLIGPQALQYGLAELSKRRRDTYLKAEFPHLWTHIEKFQGGKSEYSITAIQNLMGKNWQEVVKNLISVGLLRKRERGGQPTFWVPYLYRRGLDLTQGKIE
jgi:hypothetical protein